MDAHARNALIGFLLLALFGGLMFWLASWVSNRHMLSAPEEEDEDTPAEAASLAGASADASDDGDDGAQPER